MKEAFDLSSLEPILVESYRNTFTREEVDAMLKFYEAIGPFIMRLLKQAGVDEQTMMGALKQLDYSEHGGAPLLGVNGVSIISHGKSSPRAIKNAIKVAVQAIDSRMDEHIGRRLQEAVGSGRNGDAA